MNNPPTIAILITCHNRKDITLEALACLQQQQQIELSALDTYLVDDGSTDGTALAVRELYPQVKVLEGTGDLYWNGGMRMAFAEALKYNYDYYLWLNDDTFLFPLGLHQLLVTYEELVKQGCNLPIVCGATCDRQTNTITTSGFRYLGLPILFRWEMIPPSKNPIPCDTIAGNCVLISKESAQLVGNLDSHYSHYLADLDYGLRAKNQGCTLWIAPDYLANSPVDFAQKQNTKQINGWKALWQQLHSPKGVAYGEHFRQRLPPIQEWTYFLQTHGGVMWWLPWLLTYSKLLILIKSQIRRNNQAKLTSGSF